MKLKRCPKCGMKKRVSGFHKNRNRKDGLGCWCKKCKAIKDKKWRKLNKGLQKERSAKYYREKGCKAVARRLYGETVDFDKMYEEQKGRCAVCNKHQSELAKRLHIDHNHETGQVRSLLCHSCNVGLGHFRHRKDLMQDAINYLVRHEI